MEEMKEAKVWEELVLWQMVYQALSQVSSPSSYHTSIVGIVTIILILLVGTLKLKKKKGTATQWQLRLIPKPPLPTLPSWERGGG